MQHKTKQILMNHFKKTGKIIGKESEMLSKLSEFKKDSDVMSLQFCENTINEIYFWMSKNEISLVATQKSTRKKLKGCIAMLEAYGYCVHRKMPF